MVSKESLAHASRVDEAVRRPSFAAQRLADERLQQSWRRSLESYRLDPGRTAEPRILTNDKLRDHLESLESFLRIARHGVKKLHEQMREANYVVLLTDATGDTIDFAGLPSLDKELKHAGLYLGACWSEDEEGTCGVGTAIVDQLPIKVHKKEHFRAPNISLTCSASPVFDPEGRLLAILDASALYSPDDRKSQNLVLQFVNQSAAMIENAFFLERFRGAWVLQLSSSREFLEVQTDYLFAFDEHGIVLAANRRAQSEMALCARAGSHLEELFEASSGELIRRGLTSNLVFPLRAVTGATFYSRLRVPESETPAHPRVNPAPASRGHAARFVPLQSFAGADSSMRTNVHRAAHILNARIPYVVPGRDRHRQRGVCQDYTPVQRSSRQAVCSAQLRRHSCHAD